MSSLLGHNDSQIISNVAHLIHGYNIKNVKNATINNTLTSKDVTITNNLNVSGTIKSNTINELTGTDLTINNSAGSKLLLGGNIEVNAGGSGSVSIKGNTTNGDSYFALDRTTDTDNNYLLFRSGGANKFRLQLNTTDNNLSCISYTSGTVGWRVNQANSEFYLPSAYIQNIGATTRTISFQADGRIGYDGSILKCKTNIKDMDSDFIYKLRPVMFNYRKELGKDTYSDTKHYHDLQYGLIAEEVEQVNEELCSYDYKHDEGCKHLERCLDCDCNCKTTRILRTVHYKKLICCLLDQVQKQKITIDSLLMRVTNLEANH
jgi:hypothetical protein